MLDREHIEGVLTFLRAAERLKTVKRSGWTSAGEQESVAEHTWRLCLMAMLCYGQGETVDLGRLLKICLIHDLGEAISGDIPAPVQQTEAGRGKADQERADLVSLVAPLPTDLRAEILALWDEYESAATTEAKVAKGLDKLETILQHTQGRNPDEFDYGFNLEYGRRYTGADPLLTALRTRLDEATVARGESAARRDILRRLYRDFNARDLDAALATLLPDVRWANGMDGGWVEGRDAVRAYWSRQWTAIDPRVEPTELAEDPDGRLVVTAHQVVRDLAGAVLLDTTVRHAYRFEGGLVRSMDILED